ncbi:family 2 glycosyl transferase [Zhongshania marina]|uniref:Family 2 glycosyl transferase n=2 Tax=Zhongshania marina TaxID=2304603 RepID=A0A2S4HEU3_9GAMM|nr:family 2 glycosyl transferase [Marortus luteolus]
MATYNGGGYLSAQLQSFIEQSRQPDELIISDDCSSDETEAIVKEFAKKAPFKVEFYKNVENLGYCRNFNAALMKTTGELVLLSDQDDVWLPGKIACMEAVAQENSRAMIIMNDAALVDKDLNELRLTKIGQIESAGLSLDTFVMGCCCAIRRNLLDICLPIPASYPAHDDWIVGFAVGMNRRVIERKVLQLYRRHENNESKFIANRLTKVTRLDVFLNHLLKFFISNRRSNRGVEIEGLNLFVARLEELISVVNEVGESEISMLYRIKSKELSDLKERHEVREKALFHRIILIIGRLVKGKYSSENLLKEVAKDVAGF